MALAVPLPLGAQTTGSTRLVGRVPPAAQPAIDSIIAIAVAESLPTEPLIQKTLEGSAKNVPPDRLVSGVRRGLMQLRAAHLIVAEALPGQPWICWWRRTIRVCGECGCSMSQSPRITTCNGVEAELPRKRSRTFGQCCRMSRPLRR